MKLAEAFEKLGSKWKEISNRYFKGTRSENQVKNRRNSSAFRRLASEGFPKDAKDYAVAAAYGDNNEGEGGEREDESGDTTAPDGMDDAAPSPPLTVNVSDLRNVSQTAFTFRSDVHLSYRPEHKSGMLHALKIDKNSGREEHAFAWLHDREHENAGVVASQLVQYGFQEKKIVFVPFSSKTNWLHRYPHACEY